MAKILVVDGAPETCRALEQVLSQAGHQVRTAGSTAETLHACDAFHPDVLILDLELDLSTVGALSLVRTLRLREPALRVIGLTELAEAALEQEARALGVNDFFRKGRDLQPVLRSVEHATELVGHQGERETEPRSVEPARILVVDDEPSVRQLLQRFLGQQGYQVVTAANGEEALKALSRFHPHLILLDVIMPVMGGVAFLRQLAQQAPDVGVLLISSVQDYAVIDEAMALGSYCFFGKPIDLEWLHLSVQTKLALIQVLPTSRRQTA